MEFQLADSVVEGLRLLNGVINEEITRKSIVNAVKQMLINGPALPIRSDIYENDVKLEVKKADFAVCSILLTCAQNGIDSLKLKELLDQLKINPKTTAQLIESYDKFKEELTTRLMRFDNSRIPNLTDIDYEIQQQIIPSGEIVFKITFKGYDHEKNKDTIIEEVACNQEELHLLISKLKDIETHCERVSKFE